MNTQLSPPPDGNQNRTGAVIGVVTGTIAISGIFVVLRLYTRLFLTKATRWDDWTILLAWVLSSLFILTVMHANLDEAWVLDRRCP